MATATTDRPLSHYGDNHDHLENHNDIGQTKDLGHHDYPVNSNEQLEDPQEPYSNDLSNDNHLAHQTKALSIRDGPQENGVGSNVYAEDGEVAGEENMELGTALASDPSAMHEHGDAVSTHSRPRLPKEPSRSYSRPIPIVTTYEPELPDNASINKRRSVAGSVKAPSVRRAPSTKAESFRNNERLPARAESYREVERHERPPTRTENRESYNEIERPQTRTETVRSPSRASVRSPSIKQNARSNRESQGGASIGDVVSPERQRQLQNGGGNGVNLRDQGPVSRSTTFDDSNHAPRSMSPRPGSAFGHRPQPNLLSVVEDGQESRYDNRDGRDSRAGVLNRSGTVMSRANTVGRNGTMSRAANGGTVGSRRGAFGRGAGASIGTQPEEVLGRDDIHTRAELSERILDDATLRRLSTMEKKDANRLAKVIKAEGKSEAQSVKASIKELERMSKLQKEAAYAERKSQLRLGKWTSKEHKARLRFLKEKERYEKVEGELRNAENDYEERRDHAAGLTAQVAEKTQELDDLRGQKAADDREREVKLLALKNPAHS